jgi:HAD superfamily hydrolase (TIGR01509 family)
MSKIRGVICDIDGTLIDSNDAHTRAFLQVFAERGIEVSYEKIRGLIGKGGDKLIPEASGIPKGSDDFEEISKRRKEIYLRDYVPHLQPTPGARALLERMREEGLQIVMATSGEEDVEAALKQVGLQEFFEVKATSQDAKQSKPDPDIVQAALKRAGLSPEDAIMLGDTPYDIEAAGKAGVRTIAFLTGGWNRADLEQALAIYESPADLLTQFGESAFKVEKNGPWTVLSSERKFQNGFVELWEDQVIRPDGKPGSYATVTMKAGIAILPQDDEGNVYLTRQFRYATGKESLEVVSGGIDGDEPVEEAARRELREEMGIEAGIWEAQGLMDLDTSIVCAPVRLFRARGLTFTQPEREGTETIESVKLSLDEACRNVLNSTITHGPSCVLILKATAARQ